MLCLKQPKGIHRKVCLPHPQKQRLPSITLSLYTLHNNSLGIFRVGTVCAELSSAPVVPEENGCFAESKSQKLFWQLMTAVEYMPPGRQPISATHVDVPDAACWFAIFSTGCGW